MTLPPFDVRQFSPEFQLACACCRVKPNSSDLQNIARLLQVVDVPAFLDLVIERHRIGPLVYAALKQLPILILPSGLMAPLAAEARSNGLKALRAVRTLVLLDKWFGVAGIEWMPFKGSSVALSYYGDVSLRQVNDQDIWVPAHQLEAARDVLIAHGFAWDPQEMFWDLADRGPRHRDFVMRHFIEEQHRSAEHGRIELHWELTDNRGLFDLSPHDILTRSGRFNIGNAQLPMMERVDLLLYLCEHGGRHSWSRIKWLADLPQVLESHAWNWDDVLERAKKAGCTPSLLLGLALARNIFGWQPPDTLNRLIDASRSMTLLLHVVRVGLLAPNSWWLAPDSNPLRWLLYLQLSRFLLGNLRAFSTNCWRLSLAPRDLRVIAFPDRMFFLYRLSRPLLFLWRKIQRLIAIR